MLKYLLHNPLFIKIANIPIIWNFAQNLIGANQWKATLYPSVFQKKEGLILDFGCSSGNETSEFLDFDYYGIDLDAQVILAAQRKFQSFSNARFECVDLIQTGYKTNFFDHILFAGTGHHLTDDDLKKIFNILLQNLKIGGSLHFFDIIRQPNKDSRITQMIINSDQGKNVRTAEDYKSFFYEQGRTPSEWSIKQSPDRFIKLPDMVYALIIKS